MSLQGFSGSGLQGIYAVLQGFGDRVLRGSSPEHIFIYDDNVYVIDIETQSIKIYSITGTKIGEFPVDSRPYPPAPEFFETLQKTNTIYVDATRIIVGVTNYTVVYDYDGNEVSSAYGNGATSVFYNEEFYRVEGVSQVKVFDMDANLVRSFSLGGSFQNRGFDVKGGYVYFVGERMGVSPLAKVVLKVFDTAGTLVDEFEYWEKPGVTLPNEIGLAQGYFVAHGDDCHSGMTTNNTVYKNSTITGSELEKFTIETQRKFVGWYVDELYYSTLDSTIVVCDDTTGEVVREWSTID